MVPAVLKEMSKSLGLSFSGSGSLFVYQLGVYQALYNAIAHQNVVFGGSSGGALAATMASMHFCAKKTDCMSRLIPLLHTTGPLKVIEHELDQLNTESAQKVLRSVFVSVTRCSDGANVLRSSFQSKQELLQCLRASCHIPVSFHPLDLFTNCLSSRNLTFPAHEGVKIDQSLSTYVDGAFSASIPQLHVDASISVSPLLCKVDFPTILVHPESRPVIKTEFMPFEIPCYVTVGGQRCKICIQNLRAISCAIALTRKQREEWFHKGVSDGKEVVKRGHSVFVR